MQQLVIILHILIALALMSLVLLQHGKGADVGASFGSGAANTMFGSVGPASFLMKVTAVLTAIFFATSIGLAYISAKQRTEIFQLEPSAPVQAPAPQPVAPISSTSSPASPAGSK